MNAAMYAQNQHGRVNQGGQDRYVGQGFQENSRKRAYESVRSDLNSPNSDSNAANNSQGTSGQQQKPLGKNHWRNRRYKEKRQADKKRLKELEEKEKMWEDTSDADKEVEKITQPRNSNTPTPSSTPLPQRNNSRRCLYSRIGFSPTNVKDRLSSRTDSRTSEDSGVAESPTNMEATSRQEELFPTPPATLAGQVLQHDEVEDNGNAAEPLPGNGSPVQGCQTQEEAQKQTKKGKSRKGKGKGKGKNSGKVKKSADVEQDDDDVLLLEAGDDKIGEEEDEENEEDDTGDEVEIEEEKENDVDVKDSSGNSKAYSAQDRLMNRPSTSKDKVEDKTEKVSMAEKIKIKQEKRDEGCRKDKSLDNFVWNEKQVFEFLKTSMTRPSQESKAYQFSLFDKLDKEQVVDRKIPCDGCRAPTDALRFGDTINLLITTSTLAGMKFKDADKHRDYKCSHFEYLVVRGGTYEDLYRIACPILTFLKSYFSIQVLVVCGINDINQEPDIKKLIERVRRFNVRATSKVTKSKVEMDDPKIHPGDISVKFIGIPYPPKFTRLGRESHPIKNNVDRTQDIANLNRYFRKVNNESVPIRHVPTMANLGITEEEFTHKPTKNTHIYHEWHLKDSRWPKDKGLAKEVVHLRYSVRLHVWKAIHEYFMQIF